MYAGLPTNWSEWDQPIVKQWRLNTVPQVSDEFKDVKARVMSTCCIGRCCDQSSPCCLACSRDEEHLTPDRLFNMDESNLSTVQDGQSKIIALKGKKWIGAITTNEFGESVTRVVCMTASGWFIPPMLIYKCKRMKAELCEGAPLGLFSQSRRRGGCVGKVLLYGWSTSLTLCDLQWNARLCWY